MNHEIKQLSIDNIKIDIIYNVNGIVFVKGYILLAWWSWDKEYGRLQMGVARGWGLVLSMMDWKGWTLIIFDILGKMETEKGFSVRYDEKFDSLI